MAIKTDTFRWRRWRDTLQKLALYAIVMGCALTVHVLGQAVTIGSVNILEPFALAMPACVVLSDIVSALRNLALLLPSNGMLRRLLWGLGKRGEDLASKVAGAKEALVPLTEKEIEDVLMLWPYGRRTELRRKLDAALEELRK